MTKQHSIGYIDGHDVSIRIKGPESQDIDDGRIGSDVLMVRIERELSKLKTEIETDD